MSECKTPLSDPPSRPSISPNYSDPLSRLFSSVRSLFSLGDQERGVEVQNVIVFVKGSIRGFETPRRSLLRGTGTVVWEEKRSDVPTQKDKWAIRVTPSHGPGVIHELFIHNFTTYLYGIDG